MFLVYYEQQYHVPPNYDWNLVIVLLTLFIIDLSSWSCGKSTSGGTIRDLPDPPALKTFYSVLQFAGTASVLYGSRHYALYFYTSFVVDFNPFLMTLRRKNLISREVNTVLYSLMLLGGYPVMLINQEYTAKGHMLRDLIMLTGILLRLGPRLPVIQILQNNRYLLWLSIGLMVRQIRPLFDEGKELAMEFYLLYGILIIAFVTLFVWKSFYQTSSITSNNARNNGEVQKQKAL